MMIKNKAFRIVTIIIAVFAVTVGTYLSTRTKEQAELSNAAADVALIFSPSSLNSNINTVLTPKLTIDPTTNQVTAVEVYLTFDKSKLTINSITPSTKFPTVLRAPVIDNNAGTANFVLGINIGESITPVPITTISDIATINLTTKSVVGDALVSVVATSKVAEVGTDTSVLGTFGQMSVHINTTSNTPPSFPAWDVDQNGIVNILDIGIVVDSYGSNSDGGTRVDINKDGKVDIIDIGIIIDNYE